jgi:amino acid transporter
MLLAILLVALLYILTSVAVLGNLPLSKVISARDYALAEAARPLFGVWGFKIMALTALVATASAINASLYATTQISYTLAKEGNLPRIYQYNIFHSSEGLVVSALLIVPMILFMNLGEITTVAALTVLIVQGVVHLGHLRKIEETGAKRILILGAVLLTFAVTILTLAYTRHKMPDVPLYLLGAFAIAFLAEIILGMSSGRIVRRQILHKKARILRELEEMIEHRPEAVESSRNDREVD